MKNIKIFISLIISLLALWSCNSFVTEIDPSELPSTDSRLVLSCYISPQDTVIAAKLTETKTVISTGGTRADITNATMKISDGTKTVPLIYDNNLLYYRALPAQMKIEVGKSYSITVSTPDGRSVSSKCTVPPPITIKEIKVDSGTAVALRGLNAREVKEYYLKLIWQDLPGSVDYYRGFGFVQGTFKDRNNTVSQRTDGVDFTGLDDKNSDGQLLTLNVIYQPARNSTAATIQKLTVGLFHADINYFNYHESLRKQRGNNNNPFVEPVLLYTNVDGGFGCFGAYNATWKELKIK
jgi:Domain of unknown function (DUF4249)